MAATASYKAVPSILMVAPIGSTNLRKTQLVNIEKRAGKFKIIPRYSLIHSILFFQQTHGDWKSSGRGSGTKSRSESIGHISNESEGQFPSANGVNDGQNHKTMKEQTYQDRHEIQSQLAGHYTEVIHFQDLASNEEKDAHGGHVDDPGGDGHHGLRQTSEKLH